MGGISGSFSASVAMRPMGWGTHTSAGRGRGRGRVPGSSGPLNRTYALASHQDQEASLNAITGCDTGRRIYYRQLNLEKLFGICL